MRATGCRSRTMARKRRKLNETTFVPRHGEGLCHFKWLQIQAGCIWVGRREEEMRFVRLGNQNNSAQMVTLNFGSHSFTAILAAYLWSFLREQLQINWKLPTTVRNESNFHLLLCWRRFLKHRSTETTNKTLCACWSRSIFTSFAPPTSVQFLQEPATTITSNLHSLCLCLCLLFHSTGSLVVDRFNSPVLLCRLMRDAIVSTDSNWLSSTTGRIFLVRLVQSDTNKAVIILPRESLCFASLLILAPYKDGAINRSFWFRQKSFL